MSICNIFWNISRRWIKTYWEEQGWRKPDIYF